MPAKGQRKTIKTRDSHHSTLLYSFSSTPPFRAPPSPRSPGPSERTGAAHCISSRPDPSRLCVALCSLGGSRSCGLGLLIDLKLLPPPAHSVPSCVLVSFSHSRILALPGTATVLFTVAAASVTEGHTYGGSYLARGSTITWPHRTTTN